MSLKAGSGPSRSSFAGVWSGILGSLCCHVGSFLFPKSSWSWGMAGLHESVVPAQRVPGNAPTLNITWGWCHSGRNCSQQGEGDCPGWPQAFRKFPEPSWRAPYPFIKGCCGFFNVRLSVAWTRSNTAQWTPALAPLKLWHWCWCRL